MLETDYPTASTETLLRQAPMTAEQYLDEAVSNIDDILGDGYAASHPELLGAFIITCALDLGAMQLAKTVGYGLERLAIAIENQSL